MIGDVRILGRVLDQIADQVRGRPLGLSGGLLLGRTEGRTFIERALPCPNVGGPGVYAIDPKVLVNVRRSLGAGEITILGTYRGSSDGAFGSTEEEAAAGSLRLDIVADAEDCSWTLHLLESGKGEVELPAEVVRPEPRLLAACPE